MQSCNVIAHDSCPGSIWLEGGEESADQNLSVPLHDDTLNRVVRIRIETTIQAAVYI